MKHINVLPSTSPKHLRAYPLYLPFLNVDTIFEDLKSILRAKTMKNAFRLPALGLIKYLMPDPRSGNIPPSEIQAYLIGYATRTCTNRLPERALLTQPYQSLPKRC